MIVWPGFDPVVLPLWGPLAVRWYGLAYAAGVVSGYLMVPPLGRLCRPPVPETMIREAVLRSLLWAVVGGRLGYVLFYQPGWLLADPLALFRIWEGGMSFHGGLLGVGAGLLGYSYQMRRVGPLNTWGMCDLLATGAPVAIFFGRVANFINGELWGRITTVPWGMVFPDAGPWPRHPSQIYEALAEGLFPAVVFFALARRTCILQRSGAMTGLFLLVYGMARFVTEWFREPTTGGWGPLTWGQVLTIPVGLAGLVLLVWRQRYQGDGSGTP